MNNLTTTRFVIRKSLIGHDVTIPLTHTTNETYTYDHDEIYSTHQEKLESMACFQEDGSYTNSNTVPKVGREMREVEKPEITE